MPIKSIQQQKTRMPADPLPCLGEWKKGGPKSGNKAGRDLDHFRCVLPEDKEWLTEHIVNLYGEQPREIPGVLLTGPRIEDCFSYWLFEWAHGGKLKHKCDGETQVAHYDEATDRVLNTPIPCAQQNCNCSPRAELHFYLPELTERTGAFGYFKLSTGSWRDIARFQQFLEYMQERGPLNAIQLVIGRREEDTRVPMTDKKTGETKKRAIKKWFIYPGIDPRYVMRVMAIPDPNAPLSEPRLAIASAFSDLEMKELNARAVSQISAAMQIPAEIIDPPDVNGHQAEESPPALQPSNVDWAKGDAARRIPELRKALFINPPELFNRLNEVGATPIMPTDEIVARLSGNAPVTSQDTSPEQTDLTYKTRTTPLAADKFHDLVHTLIKDDLRDKPIINAQKSSLAILLKEAVPVDKPKTAEFDRMRGLIIGYLFDGKPGLRDLTAGEALALINAITTDNPRELHPAAYVEIGNVLTEAEALADLAPAQPVNGETIEGEVLSEDEDVIRTPDDLYAAYADWYNPEDGDDVAGESPRQDVLVQLKTAITFADKKTAAGRADSAALNAIGFLTGQNSIKGLSVAHCNALLFWIAGTPTVQLGHEALACANAYEDSKQQEGAT